MNVKRYYMYAGDGPGVYPEEDVDGEWVLWQDYSKVVKENNQIWETFVKVADRLGIDPKEAMKAPGKPSDVFIAKINELEKTNEQ